MAGKFFLSVIVLSLVCTFAVGGDESKNSASDTFYDVQISWRHGGKLLMEPRLIVPAGEPATLRIANTRDGGLELMLVADNEGIVQGRSMVSITMTLNRISGKGELLERLGEPSIWVPDDQVSEVSAVISVSGSSSNDGYDVAIDVARLTGAEATSLAAELTGSSADEGCERLSGGLAGDGGHYEIAGENCCSAPCGDGSGQDLTCCSSTGPIFCCGCGTCCSG